MRSERRVRERQRTSSLGPETSISSDDRAWMEEPRSAAVLVVIQGRLKQGGRLFPDANLELDLGFDSMERVELLTELEQRVGAKVSQQAASEIFTVRQLVAALATDETRHLSTDSAKREGGILVRAPSGPAAG